MCYVGFEGKIDSLAARTNAISNFSNGIAAYAETDEYMSWINSRRS